MCLVSLRSLVVYSHKAFFEGTISEIKNKGEYAEESLQILKNVNNFC